MGWPDVCWPNQPIFLKYSKFGISNFFFYFVAGVANYLQNITKFETFCCVAKTLAKTS